MHEFPADFDPNLLSGWRVRVVCLFENMVWLDFEEAADSSPFEQVRVQVMAEFTYANVGDALLRLRVPALHVNLGVLVGAVVRTATVDAENTLALRFEDGQQFACHQNRNFPESYMIERRGECHYV